MTSVIFVSLRHSHRVKDGPNDRLDLIINNVDSALKTIYLIHIYIYKQVKEVFLHIDSPLEVESFTCLLDRIID